MKASNLLMATAQDGDDEDENLRALKSLISATQEEDETQLVAKYQGPAKASFCHRRRRSRRTHHSASYYKRCYSRYYSNYRLCWVLQQVLL